MPLNAKVAAEIDRQVSVGKMQADYAAKLKETFNDAPDEFQASFLAGPDYQRNQQALKADKDAFEAQKTEWKTWKSTADEEYAGMQTRVNELQAKLDAGGNTQQGAIDLKKEIDNIKAGLLSEIKAQGFVTKSEYEKELARTKSEGVGLMASVLEDQRKVESQFQKDFGKPFDPAMHTELVTIANEAAAKKGAYVPLEEAYRMKFGDDVKKLEQERWKAEGRKERDDEYARNSVPGAGGNGMSPGSQAGPLQQRMQQLQGKDFTQTDGDLQAAKASAVELLRAGGAR